jgi:hypothetical protein
MMPKRVQMSRQKPWRADNPDAVIVARPTMFGNPYTIAMMTEQIAKVKAVPTTTPTELLIDLQPRALAVEAFRADLTYGPDSRWWWFGPHMAIIRIKGELQRGTLAGVDLAYWCPLDQPCHADVLIEIANGGAA